MIRTTRSSRTTAVNIYSCCCCSKQAADAEKSWRQKAQPRVFVRINRARAAVPSTPTVLLHCFVPFAESQLISFQGIGHVTSRQTLFAMYVTAYLPTERRSSDQKFSVFSRWNRRARLLMSGTVTIRSSMITIIVQFHVCYGTAGTTPRVAHEFHEIRSHGLERRTIHRPSSVVQREW